MPAISAPAKVLVTGASGYFAIHLSKALVDRGYDVRGTVRSASKGEYLKKLLGSKFEYAIVPDMQQPGAFDAAVQGIDVVQHIAAVVTLSGPPKDTIDPIVHGTTSLLDSVLRYGTSVKRFVLCSTTMAIGPSFDESTYNDEAVKSVEEAGDDASPADSYAAAKVISERLTEKFMEDNKAAVGFDLVTLCPPYIFGPALHEGDITFSINHLFTPLRAGGSLTESDLARHHGEAVDVRDLATLFVDMMSVEAASGERFITAYAPWTWQHLLNALHESPEFPNVPIGNPDAIKDRAYTSFSSAKLYKLLEKSAEEIWRPLDVTLRDTVVEAQSRGWIRLDNTTQ